MRRDTQADTPSSEKKIRKRQPKAAAKLNEILHAQRSLVRRTTLAVLVLRLAPIIVPVVLRFALDAILPAETPCHYNFIRPHRALKFGSEMRTPAMQAGFARRRLSFREVFLSEMPRAPSRMIVTPSESPACVGFVWSRAA